MSETPTSPAAVAKAIVRIREDRRQLMHDALELSVALLFDLHNCLEEALVSAPPEKRRLIMDAQVAANMLGTQLGRAQTHPGNSA